MINYAFSARSQKVSFCRYTLPFKTDNRAHRNNQIFFLYKNKNSKDAVQITVIENNPTDSEGLK